MNEAKKTQRLPRTRVIARLIKDRVVCWGYGGLSAGVWKFWHRFSSFFHHRPPHATNELWPETANTLKRVIGRTPTCFNTFVAFRHRIHSMMEARLGTGRSETRRARCRRLRRRAAAPRTRSVALSDGREMRRRAPA